MEAAAELDRLLQVSQTVLHRQSLLCGGLPETGLPTTQRLFTTHHKVLTGRLPSCCLTSAVEMLTEQSVGSLPGT